MEHLLKGRSIVKILSAVILALIFSVTSSHAAAVILQWEAIPDSGIEGYKVYYKTSSSGTPYNGRGAYQGRSPVTVHVKDLYDPSHPEYTLFHLKDKETYFIAVTAYKTGRNHKQVESDYSNMVVFSPQSSDENFTPIRVNAGGKKYIDNNGTLWSKDFGSRRRKKKKTRHPISGMLDDVLFQTESWNKVQLSYQFDVPDGIYRVNLYFSEINNEYSQVGKRVFDILLEGKVVLSDLDVFSEVGHDAALVKSFMVPVNDGQLDIDFYATAGHPKVSAIEIIKR